ncbi:SET domain-containing protein [Calocera cornea HHB12733]|uniref:SET domain-containing protein n=1 Tax=Calocera cornea HHB12733 TaxID=1353952 RepID=A0A165FUA5_9BASI|nr:SET domain-containing protein [Calocera cornea HHB12733]
MSATHPAPTPLELVDTSDIDPAAFFARQGTRTVRLGPNDPAVHRAQEISVLGYGHNADRTDWDTVCITYADNRLQLRNHFGFDKCISAELKKVVALSVEVVDVPGKGSGLRATRDIPRGQTFLLERPLLTCMHTMDVDISTNFDMILDKSMTKEHKKAYYKLHNCKPKGPGMIESLSIMRTNGLPAEWPFDTSDSQSAVFETISRANHSCVPNATYDWSFKHFSGALRSVVPIKAGAEITISYTSKMFSSAAERKAELLEKYAFECTCPSCTFSPPRQKKSDERREALGKRDPLRLDNNFLDETRIESGYDDPYIVETLNMCDSEGLIEQRADMLVAYARFEAMRSALTGDFSRAEELAKRAIKEIKKIGYHTSWGSMDIIMALKTAANAAPKKSNLLDADLKMLANTSVQVVNIPGKGPGLRATRDVPGGEIFLIERPLITCMSMMSRTVVTNFDKFIKTHMTSAHQEVFFKLHNCKPRVLGVSEALDIMRTNSLAMNWSFDEEEQYVVFDLICRANHSCVPNAMYESNL